MNTPESLEQFLTQRLQELAKRHEDQRNAMDGSVQILRALAGMVGGWVKEFQNKIEKAEPTEELKTDVREIA